MMRSLAPLRHRDFRYLVGGQLASNVGDACYAVALPWYVLAEHGGALLLGAVLVAYGIPRIVLVAVGGAASDRWRPWTVMMVSDVVRTFVVAALAVVALAGPARAEFLIPIAVVLGAGEGLFLPGSFSIVPSLLPNADLQAGNALSSSGTQLATLVGPALGGVVVGFFGPGPAFVIDAGTFALSALSLAAIRSIERPRATEGAPVAPAAADAPAVKMTLRRLLLTKPVLVVVVLITFAANMGSGGLVEVAIPSLAHGPLHIGAAGFGGLIAAFGAGALVGTLGAAQAPSPRRPAVVGTIAFLVEGILCALAPYLGGAIAAGVALFGFGVCNGFGNVITLTALQRWAPADVLGRVASLLLLGAFGVFPISVALGALVVNRFGPALFFPIAGVLLIVAVLGGLTQRSWRNLGFEEPRAVMPDAVPERPA